jgi:hypothetical protein
MYDIDVTFECDTVNGCNQREHWGTRARRARTQRAKTSAALSGRVIPPGPWEVKLTRHGRRAMDSDGLASALKSIRDAVASRLGVDDGPASPVVWEATQARWDGPPQVRIRIRSTRQEAGDLGGREGLPIASESPFAGERSGDASERSATRSDRPRTFDRLDLRGHGFEGPPVRSHTLREGYRSASLATCPLDVESFFYPRSDARPLELGERVQERPHERRLGTVAKACPIGRHDSSPRVPRHALGARSVHYVASETVPLRDDEEPGPKLPASSEGGKQRRAIRDRKPTAHPSVNVPRGDRHAPARRPRFNCRPLRIEPQGLVNGRNAKVGNGDESVSLTNGARFSHAGKTFARVGYSKNRHETLRTLQPVRLRHSLEY